MNSRNDMLRSLQQEEGYLSEILSKNSDFKRLEAVRAVLTVYADGNDGGTLEKDILEPVEKKRSYLSAAAMIVQGAEKLLRKRRERLTAGQVVEALTGEGIDIPGPDKTKRASGALSSRKKLFDNQPGKGYGLVEWSQIKETPDKLPGASEEQNPGTGTPEIFDNPKRSSKPFGG